jgi:hypothetical protein
MEQIADPFEATKKQITADYKAGKEDMLIKKTALLLSHVKNLHKEHVWLANLEILSKYGIRYETALSAYMELQDPR